MSETYDFEVVVMTSGVRGTPHAEALAASNPGLVTWVKTSAEMGLEGWRNPDRNIRDWWIANRGAVATRRVLFIEYDVLVKMDLREIFPASARWRGIEGCHLMQPVRDGRMFEPFREVNRLPATMRPWAIGLVPLAILMISVDALDEAAKEEHNALFAADVFSEMRLPTVIRAAGHRVGVNARLSHITPATIPYPAEAVGIWHGVKTGGGQ